MQSEAGSALVERLRQAYGLNAQEIRPAQRGFYGQTWKVLTDQAAYFIKVDAWPHHQQIFRRSLFAVRFLMDQGINFIPKLHATLDQQLSISHNGGVLAVFDFLDGIHLEHASLEQQFGQLAKVYRLNAAGLPLPRERFDASVLAEYQALRAWEGLPPQALLALDEKASLIAFYAKRLRRFAAVCMQDLSGFHLTHGDAGGNCILVGQRAYLVDWDAAMLAPPERDAWINIWDPEALEGIQRFLDQNELSYSLQANRLCYYSYDWFFRYLTEHLQAIRYAQGPEQQQRLVRGLEDYLEKGWILRQLKAANSFELPSP